MNKVVQGQTLESSVQALILVSSMPPTSAGLMLFRSFVSRGNRTWKKTEITIIYQFYILHSFVKIKMHVKTNTIYPNKTSLPCWSRTPTPLHPKFVDHVQEVPFVGRWELACGLASVHHSTTKPYLQGQNTQVKEHLWTYTSLKRDSSPKTENSIIYFLTCKTFIHLHNTNEDNYKEIWKMSVLSLTVNATTTLTLHTVHKDIVKLIYMNCQNFLRRINHFIWWTDLI